MKKSVLLMMALMAASSAHASIIYVFQSVTPLGGGLFDWKYQANLSADQKINSTLSPSFAVIYDFLGAQSVSTSNSVAGLTLTNFLENTTTPQPFAQSVPDSPTQMNVHTTITGSFNAGVLTHLYDVDVISTASIVSMSFLNQSAQAVKDAPGSPADNTTTGNTALVAGPTALPEPATSAAMGLGLLAVGLIMKRRKSA